jgi:predicted transcriptional regulator
LNSQVAAVAQTEAPEQRKIQHSLIKRHYSHSSKRNSLGVISDILTVSLDSCGTTQLMACANLSFRECQRYTSMLEMTGLLQRHNASGSRVRYIATDKGREYLRDFFSKFGTIAEGERTVWSSRKDQLETPGSQPLSFE